MIKPTVGRVMWFRPYRNIGITQPYAAIVTHVHSDTCVNLAYFNENGQLGSVTSVWIRRDDESPPPYDYAEWMPYQIGQAAKTEKVVASLEQARAALEAGSTI